MPARNVNLTDHLASFVDRQVATGRHQNASEVIREALRRYEDEVALASALQSIAEAGRSALAAGDFIAVNDPEEAGALRDRLIAESTMPEGDGIVFSSPGVPDRR